MKFASTVFSLSIFLTSFLSLAERTPDSKIDAEIFASDTLILPVSEDDKTRHNLWRSHGEPFDDFLGVSAFANKWRGKYQCTESTHRVLKELFGVPTRIGIGLGHANTMVRNIYKRFRRGTYSYQGQPVKMVLYKNGSAKEPPAPGAALNFSSGKFGHVAIVRYTEVINSQKIRVYLFEQHGFPKWKVGQHKPIRSVDFVRTKKGRWKGLRKKGVGLAIHWINMKYVD